MLAIVLMMLVILLVAAAVVVYVAYPHRGGEVPGAPWLGRLLHRGAMSLRTLRQDERGHDERDQDQRDQDERAESPRR